MLFSLKNTNFLTLKLILKLKSDDYIKDISKKISDEKTFPSSFYGIGTTKEDHGTCKCL